MKRGVQTGLAVGFGYLLGRRRKLRSVLVLAAAVAVGRYSGDPTRLIKRGTAMLGANPELGRVTRLGRPLAAAGKAAAAAAVNSQIDNLSGRLRRQADALRHPAEGTRHRAEDGLDLPESPEVDGPPEMDGPPEVDGPPEMDGRDGDIQAEPAGRDDRAGGKTTPVKRTRATARRPRRASGVAG